MIGKRRNTICNMEQKPKRNIKIEIVLGVTVLSLLMIFIANFLFTRNELDKISNMNGVGLKSYTEHYAFICESGNTDFWDAVYEGAVEEGRNQNIYVERFGSQLLSEYDKEKLMQIAINSAVDGIILDAGEDTEITQLIDQAVSQDIPVITVRNDSTKSMRQAFVGISSYNLGQKYGDEVLKVIDQNTKKIMVLMETSYENMGQNIAISGIRDTIFNALGMDCGIEIEGVTIDESNAFGSEEAIRDIFMDVDNIPDIMICLSSVYTKCAYQAAVDLNKVGQITILGYHDSTQILEAVSKKILQSTISIDCDAMGRACVDALVELKETGYVSAYQPIEARVIETKDANELLSIVVLED